MSERFERLLKLLKELFQLDQPDLDFGLYRVMHAKSGEVSRFLEHTLPPTVRGALGDGDEAFESEIYDDLYRFFRRYYSDGDFLAKRVYREGTYAIPYAGEEVKLYWANRDQYYIKTSEYFRDYVFTLGGKRRVRFALRDAVEGEHNNVKATNERERVFVLCAEEPLTVAGEELVIAFEYRAPRPGDWPDGGKPKSPNQREFVALAARAILSSKDPKLATWLAELATRLEVNLQRYVARNTFDYFIHRDLGGFLRRELDFFVKNEVVHLDDLEHQQGLDLERTIARVRIIRTIAHKLIDFLAQLEDFQKKLWLKRKFVVEATHLVRLGCVPRELLADIAANTAQRDEWARVCGVDGSTLGALEANPDLIVDTAHFDRAFRERLLASFTDLDEATDGVLVHGENFQALNLLRKRYAGSARCIYIDPPYNARTSEILYKNTYRHSSWLTLMHDRVAIARELRMDDGVFVCAIDENEQERLGLLLEEIFPNDQRTCVAVVHNPRGIQGAAFSYTHEYAYFVHRPGLSLGLRRLDDAKSKPLMKTGSESARDTAQNCFYPIFLRDGAVVGFGDVPPDDFHPPRATVKRGDGSLEVWPISSSDKQERKWRYARQSVEEIARNLEVRPGRDGEPVVYLAKDAESYRTVWSDAEFNAAEHGSTLLKNVVPGDFSFPKSLWTVTHALEAAKVRGGDLAIDFFGGSGTTAHAVMHLNRQDGARRKFVVVEMAQYFDTVLLPRVKRVAYAPEWSGCKPTRRATPEETAAAPRVVKVLRLESYEDTLNNLDVRRTRAQQELFESPKALDLKEDYVLRYMLDVETRGSRSLLATSAFAAPDKYTLRVKRPSGDESREVTIDLVETFNLLLGLRVRRIEATETVRGEWSFRAVTGALPDGRRALIVWRTLTADLEKDNAVLDAWYRARPAGEGVDVVYVNGDCHLATDGGPTVYLLDSAFRELMFEDA